jgi:phosphomannomutase
MLEAKVGPHHYDRWDLRFDEERRQEIERNVREHSPATLGGKAVTAVDDRDGYRFVLEGGYWALVRFSGTEPLLRIYAEAESPEAVQALLTEARALTGV